MIEKLTKAFNGIKSTIKDTYNLAGMQGIAGLGLAGGENALKYMKGGRNDIKAAFGMMKAGGMRGSKEGTGVFSGVGRGAQGFHAGAGVMEKAGAGGVAERYTRMAVGGGTALGAGAAAADFLNPWGLGFGD